jgi:hypothetical protein
MKLFCDADATLAAATLDFNLVKERLQVRLERDLTQNITTKAALTGAKLKQSMEETLSLFQKNVDDITTDLSKDIQRMDNRLAQLTGSLQHHNSSFITAIKTISTNTSRLAEETSALSVQVVNINHTWNTCLASKKLGDSKWTITSNRWANLPRSSWR